MSRVQNRRSEGPVLLEKGKVVGGSAQLRIDAPGDVPGELHRGLRRMAIGVNRVVDPNRSREPGDVQHTDGLKKALPQWFGELPFDLVTVNFLISQFQGKACGDGIVEAPPAIGPKAAPGGGNELAPKHLEHRLLGKTGGLGLRRLGPRFKGVQSHDVGPRVAGHGDARAAKKQALPELPEQLPRQA